MGYIFLKIIIAIAIIARLMNFGWYTILMIAGGIPVHMVAFYLINKKLFSYTTNNANLNSLIILIILSSITFVMPYILYPDGGDIGGTYAIFGLVKNPPMILDNISKVIFVSNIIILIIELMTYLDLRKKYNF